MSIDSDKDIECLREIGNIVSETLRLVREACLPGIKTRELDELASQYLSSRGAKSAPKFCYNFPASICISVNNEVAHGFPGSRRIKAGDLVNVDVSAVLNGYFADTGASFVVPPIKSELRNLCYAAHGALQECLKVVKAGVPLNEIGRTIEPFLSNGAWKVDESNEGWTLKTPKQYRSAQFEHTLIVTKCDPIVLTHHP